MIKAPDVTLIYVVVSFVIAYAILRKTLFGPVGRILDEREQEEKRAAKAHAESLAGLEKAIAEAERQLAAARREALRERETLRAQGRAHLDRKLGEARAAASASVDAARRQISAEAQRSSAELPQKATGLARVLAEKILGRKLAA